MLLPQTLTCCSCWCKGRQIYFLLLVAAGTLNWHEGKGWGSRAQISRSMQAPNSFCNVTRYTKHQNQGFSAPQLPLTFVAWNDSMAALCSQLSTASRGRLNYSKPVIHPTGKPQVPQPSKSTTVSSSATLNDTLLHTGTQLKHEKFLDFRMSSNIKAQQRYIQVCRKHLKEQATHEMGTAGTSVKAQSLLEHRPEVTSSNQ